MRRIPAGRFVGRDRPHRVAAEPGTAPEALRHHAPDAFPGGDALGSLLAAARAPVGRYRSGHTDTARNHDAALDEIWGERREQ